LSELLAVDLFCGLGGWTEGFQAEGFRMIGFDVTRHVDADGRGYPGQLVLQDVLTIHGSQFRNAAGIVASPPCTEPSYRAMPWKRAKALNDAGPPVKFIELFDACFRIQREASEAAGRSIPLIVENVRGAQQWVGKAVWHFGSYYLWGDVPALMPVAIKIGVKASGQDWNRYKETGEVSKHWGLAGIKQTGIPGERWFNEGAASFGSKSNQRKLAAAMIAKIPFPLAQHIAQYFRQNYEAENRSLCIPV